MFMGIVLLITGVLFIFLFWRLIHRDQYKTWLAVVCLFIGSYTTFGGISAVLSHSLFGWP
ncbi:MAG: hypothetical protein Q8R55_03580 [Candidatus Taylorbacteria bacterium]|nr:hypothetical protein [Candidatus Taylorbacteria bacterium]